MITKSKTTFSLYSFVYQPLVQMLGNPKLKIIFFALEMSSEVLMAKLLSLHVLDTYGVKLEYKEILSLGTKLSDEKYALIKVTLLAVKGSHCILNSGKYKR